MNKFFCVFLFLSSFAVSQTFSEQYNNGLNCFLNKDYVCAKMHFSEIVKSNADVNQSMFEYSMYYYFLSSLHLYHEDTGYLFDNLVSYRLFLALRYASFEYSRKLVILWSWENSFTKTKKGTWKILEFKIQI